MRALILLVLAFPVLADAPQWRAKAVCEKGKMVGLLVLAPAQGAIKIEFDPSQACFGVGVKTS